MVEKGIYKHFKGNKYIVLHTAIHSETGEELIIYARLDNRSQVWARPKSMFVEKIDRDDYKGYRFSYLGNEE